MPFRPAPNIQRELDDPTTTPAQVLDLLFPASAVAASRRSLGSTCSSRSGSANPRVLNQQLRGRSGLRRRPQHLGRPAEHHDSRSRHGRQRGRRRPGDQRHHARGTYPERDPDPVRWRRTRHAFPGHCPVCGYSSAKFGALAGGPAQEQGGRHTGSKDCVPPTKAPDKTPHRPGKADSTVFPADQTRSQRRATSPRPRSQECG